MIPLTVISALKNFPTVKTVVYLAIMTVIVVLFSMWQAARIDALKAKQALTNLELSIATAAAEAQTKNDERNDVVRQEVKVAKQKTVVAKKNVVETITVIKKEGTPYEKAQLESVVTPAVVCAYNAGLARVCDAKSSDGKGKD